MHSGKMVLLTQQSCTCLQATFYGQQGGQDDMNVCSIGAARGNTMNMSWTSGTDTFIALNRPQFGKPLALYSVTHQHDSCSSNFTVTVMCHCP